MIEKFVALVSCLLCAIPFFIMARFDKNSSTPISFWTGDVTLKEQITDIAGYNAKMAKLYWHCADAFVFAGICCLLSVPVGIIIVMCESTVGIYVVYRKYKRILDEFS